MKTSMKQNLALFYSLVLIFVFGLLLDGCATTWNKERKKIKASYKRGEISNETYDLKIRKIEQEEKISLQEAAENKILRKQAEERKREGYYIPPLQIPTTGKHKNCSARCDYYGNCETVCE